MRLQPLVVGLAALSLFAVIDAGASAAPAPSSPSYAVGSHTATFVDASRPTKANGGEPKHAERSLPTTIFYPATGTASANPATDAPGPDAPAATEGGPFPLIVFAHGLGATLSTTRDCCEAGLPPGTSSPRPVFP